ncbi:DUF4145 domain-containing protein [Kutzneria chonburiensis]|uniref:DUF4145 domain-containing protein n=1 Tax=Kutzneria chonburiensis TaxID=1483604 RepID=A0ABV6MHV5_9PSEU
MPRRWGASRSRPAGKVGNRSYSKACRNNREGIQVKIEKLHEQGRIRAHVKDGAHEVRELGNEMAHGDFVTPISFEEANLTLILMSEVLDDVFQSPARVQRARDARLARQTAANTSPQP